jgi:hypothetical protein
MKKAILILVLGLLCCNNLSAKEIPKKRLKDDYVFKQNKTFIWPEGMGNYKTWVPHMTPNKPWNLRYERNIVRVGKYSMRFEMRAGDCGKGDCKRGNFKGAYGRSEMYMHSNGSLDPKYDFDHGEHWYAWSIYIPEETSDIRPAYTILGQWKEHTKYYKKRWKKYDCVDDYHVHLYFNLDPEGIKLRREYCIKKNNKVMAGGFGKYIIPTSELKNKWQDFLLHVNWSAKEDGFMHLWVNDKKVYEEHGITADIPVTVDGKKSGVSFRFGIYNGKIDKYEKRLGKKRPTQVVYYDSIKVVYYDSIKIGTTCQDTALWHDCNNLPIK